MLSITRQPRLLVKMAGAPKTAPLKLAGAPAAQFAFEPLFKSIRPASEPGFAPGTEWFLMSASSRGDELNSWDACHYLMTEGLGIAGASTPVFAEPDLEQQWVFGTEPQHAMALTSTCSKPEAQNPKLPHDATDDFWFRDGEHTQLEAAREKAGDPGAGKRVRIAHFDTGYDPTHKALPKFLRRDLQKNFVDQQFPDDASDRSEGLFNSLGHGTGTIGILAGSLVDGETLGGAPNAEIVPVRVANSVVLFRSSALAKAFDYVHSLATSPDKRIHVITMSMGGVASQSWADAVNELYDLGVFIVTAAGNNFGNLPTRNIVHPARFKRVLAACGVMFNQQPYADLPIHTMAGNYGPRKKMSTAMAAYTPNAPWPKLGCDAIVDRDGRGTSAATPQLAAAAALWIQSHRAQYDQYPKGWMKVEAVRKALFAAAGGDGKPDKHLGRGALRAFDALAQKPAAAAQLRQEGRDSASFAALRILTGLGLAAPGARQRMLELEALQLARYSHELEQLLPDPDADPGDLPPEHRRRILEALAEAPGASRSLRQALGVSSRAARPQIVVPDQMRPADRDLLRRAMYPQLPEPQTRRVRVFAYDPLLGTRLETFRLNETVLEVRWERDLKAGPAGEYIEVVDIDPSSGYCYAPVDLNLPAALAREGLSPSESDPRFHQQMVYAVAMKTIEHFERALGRVALWAPHVTWPHGRYKEHFVRRLRIYPHALREANAYYSPDKKALLFGYFPASKSDPGDNLPGGTVFTCLSHDIIAHETTHALLDGLHRRFREPTNPDVFAFHEAFADIVALFQHFTVPEALRHQIAKTRGDLGRQNLLGELAQQFGQATGRYGALRSAIGAFNRERKVWEPAKPTPQDYENAKEPHDRGAVLVAAVFDAFLSIHRRRSEDLIRLATGGTGVLTPGAALPVDLVNRLAEEASRTASHILNVCIRALDYCPPVDLTFGDYIRALITADRDLVPDDKLGYRVAFIEAFRRRGIYPRFVRNISPETLCWQGPEVEIGIEEGLRGMNFNWGLDIDRRAADQTSRENGKKLAQYFRSKSVSNDDTLALGFDREAPRGLEIGGVAGELRGFEVHSVRPVRRIGPGLQQRMDLVIEITQSWVVPSGSRFRGGCTLIADMDTQKIRYCIRKRVAHAERIEQETGFRMAFAGADPRGTYFGKPKKGDEPFAMLHR
jgi:subtilisin family serine protease